MGENRYGKTFIKAWRKHRGLSLRRLADRLEIHGPGESISHASLGRIENGKQPYSQPIIEALANALDCSVTDLLSVDPKKDGEVVDLLRMIRERDLKMVREVIKALPKTPPSTGTDG